MFFCLKFKHFQQFLWTIYFNHNTVSARESDSANNSLSSTFSLLAVSLTLPFFNTIAHVQNQKSNLIPSYILKVAFPQMNSNSLNKIGVRRVNPAPTPQIREACAFNIHNHIITGKLYPPPP